MRSCTKPNQSVWSHDDVIKWKHFPRYWPFVRRIHRSPVNSPHKGQWRGALIFSLICVWINGWVNNREVGDMRRYRAHYDVTVMTWIIWRRDTNGINDLVYHLILWWLVAYSTLSNSMSLSIWTLVTIKKNIAKNMKFHFQENAQENVICKMVAIFSRPQCIKRLQGSEAMCVCTKRSIAP